MEGLLHSGFVGSQMDDEATIGAADPATREECGTLV